MYNYNLKRMVQGKIEGGGNTNLGTTFLQVHTDEEVGEGSLNLWVRKAHPSSKTLCTPLVRGTQALLATLS